MYNPSTKAPKNLEACTNIVKAVSDKSIAIAGNAEEPQCVSEQGQDKVLTYT